MPGYNPPRYNVHGYPHHYYQLQVEHPSGTTVLVLGILSLVLCAILGPFGWAKGNEAMRDCALSPGRYSNRGSIQAGRICGIVASCLFVLQILLIIVVVAAALPRSFPSPVITGLLASGCNWMPDTLASMT